MDDAFDLMDRAINQVGPSLQGHTGRQPQAALRVAPPSALLAQPNPNSSSPVVLLSL